MQLFKLRFSPDEIPHYASEYTFKVEDELMQATKEAGKRGHLTLAELLKICRWKSPRSAGHVKRNTEAYVDEITRFALNTENERARIESLTLLDGVSWPTASVILHLGHSSPYPILDFRALWTLSVEVPSSYNFSFWWHYVEFCRALAQRYDVDMRTLDRALWQYSKERQK